MKLLGNKFLIKKDLNKYNGNIILLNDKNSAYPYTGEIVLVGNQIQNSKYKIGDRIVFMDIGYEETDIMKYFDDNDVYVMVEEKNICAVIKQ